MTAQEWTKLILDAARDPNGPRLGILARYLEEVDMARERLKELGFGVTGTPIAKQVEEVAREVKK